MSKQQYLWMLGLMVAWQQQFDDDQDEPSLLAMDRVMGVVGCFRQYERQAANEFAARLLILLLVWMWNCANNNAKTANFGPEICKLTGREFFSLIPSFPHGYCNTTDQRGYLTSAIMLTSPQI